MVAGVVAGVAAVGAVALAEPRFATDPMRCAGNPSSAVWVLGIPVDIQTTNQVDDWVRAVVSGPWDGRCRQLITLNPEYVVRARHDSAFKRAIVGADLRVADGVGIIYAARLLGGRRANGLQRITGVDIVERMAELIPAGAHLFLLGGTAEAGQHAARQLSAPRGIPDFAVSWTGGTPDPGDDAASLSRIADSGATAVCVAYGAPGQVSWIERNQEALAASGVRLAVGVGGAIDILGGNVPRAPRWMRQGGLEWLYRLVREPWRWRRQLALPQFAALVIAQRLGFTRSQREEQDDTMDYA